MKQSIPGVLGGTQGAMNGFQTNPLLDKAMRESIFPQSKDIWGSTFSTFMGMSSDQGGLTEIADDASSYNRAFNSESIVYRCVDIRGAALASVPLQAWTSQNARTRKSVAHELLQNLAITNPIGFCANEQLGRYTLASMDLHGHAAWKIALDKRGKPAEFYWLQPESYKAVRDAQTFFGGLEVWVNNRKVIYPPNQVFYAATVNPRDPLQGTSKITGLRNAINLRQYGQTSNITFFKNNMRPDMILTGAFSPTEENVNLIRRLLNRLKGDHNRGPLILPHDMKVNLLTAKTSDAEWLGQQAFSREEILASFGVPPPVYGDLSRATFENISAAYEHFWITTMIPEMDQLANRMTTQLLWRFYPETTGKIFLGYDYTQIEALQEDVAKIWERFMMYFRNVTQAVRFRQITPNQSRMLLVEEAIRLGLNADPWKGGVPGGDNFYERFQFVPLSELSVQANVDIQAARAGLTDGEVQSAGNGSWVLPKAPPRPITGVAGAAPPVAPKKKTPPAVCVNCGNVGKQGKKCRSCGARIPLPVNPGSAPTTALESGLDGSDEAKAWAPCGSCGQPMMQGTQCMSCGRKACPSCGAQMIPGAQCRGCAYNDSGASISTVSAATTGPAVTAGNLPMALCPNCGRPGPTQTSCLNCGGYIMPTQAPTASTQQPGRVLNGDQPYPTAPKPVLPQPPQPQASSAAPGETKAAKQNPIAIRNKRLAPVQDWTIRKLKRFFQDQQTEVLRNLRAAGANVAASAPDKAAKGPKKPSGPVYDAGSLWDHAKARDAVSAIVATTVAKSAEQAYASAAEDYGLGVSWAVDHPFLAKHMGSRLGMIQNIDRTTEDALKAQLLEGGKAGETIPQLAVRVKSIYNTAKTSRATTIARTETIQAYGKASLSAYREAKVDKAEMYDGTEDDDCSAVDGQQVSMDEADALMNDEHPNGTRGVAPVI